VRFRAGGALRNRSSSLGLDSGTIDAYGWVKAANPSPWGTNMHKLLRLLAAALVATAAAPALATNGMRMIGFSPVQNAVRS
jgi:hypothetical protein